MFRPIVVDLSLPFYVFVRKICSQNESIVRVILFGSRARGDATKTSDFDIAVVVPALSEDDWARFVSDLRESAPTLCHVDIVRLESQIRNELRHHIEREGIVIYERA